MNNNLRMILNAICLNSGLFGVTKQTKKSFWSNSRRWLDMLSRYAVPPYMALNDSFQELLWPKLQVIFLVLR